MERMIRGRAFVLGDDIDTDQIIPAEYLTYNPSLEEERKFFGKYACCGVPDAQSGLPDGGIPLVAEGAWASEFQIVVAGKNFGCGSSREHAPLSLAVAGITAVIAEFYARIFYRNSVNGGYVVPVESTVRLVDEIRTGDELEIDLDQSVVRNRTSGKEYQVKELGEVLPIIEAGDIFEYAKKAGMINS